MILAQNIEGLAQNFHTLGCGVDISLSEPLLARSTGIARQVHLDRYAMGRPQSPMQTPYGRRTGEITRLLYAGVGQVLPLIFLGIRCPLKRPKAKAASTGKAPCLFLVLPLTTNAPIDLLAALNRIVQLGQLIPEEDRVEVLAIALRLDGHLAQHAISLSSTPSPAVEDLIDRAINECFLRTRLRAPHDFRRVLSSRHRSAAHP